MIVKAWIDNGIINCMSQKCTVKMIRESPDSEILMCPRINICNEYEIIIKERVFVMKNKLNIGDEIIVRQGENVVGNGEKGKVTGINIFQEEILYNIELERGFDNDGCLPIQTTQVKEGEYEPIYNTLPEPKKVRCKFTCSQKSVTNAGETTKIELVPSWKDTEENKKFFKYTPSGNVMFYTLNPDAAASFVEGKDYYIDFTAAE